MSTRARTVAGVAAAVVLLAVGLTVVKVRSGASGSGKPNVLVIMTDDQTLESMRVMDNVNRLIGDRGARFTNYFATFPSCCPSRATYLTGQFAHNNGVEDNVPPNGGFAKLKGDETLPVWLQRAGYYTASIGKYLNGYGSKGDITPPPGWSHFFGLIDPSTYHYYNYSVTNDGRQQDYGSQPEDYQTDVLGAEVVSTITQRAKSGQPWYVSWTPLAPHAQDPEGSSGEQKIDKTNIARFPESFPTPAEKYKGTMADQLPPKGPAYDQADVSKMPQFIQKQGPLGPGTEGWIQKEYRQELESLKSVDEWVGTIFDTLTKTGQLDNTVVIFTSDNGFYHGEHRLAFVKVFLYEEGVHVPLLIRGGPFAAGQTVDQIAMNTDLTPTILGLTGATAGLQVDGTDLAPMARDPNLHADRVALLENWTKYGKSHTVAVRTQRWFYSTNEAGEEELYDLDTDRAQIDNKVNAPEMLGVKDELGKLLYQYRSCQGSSCMVEHPPISP